MILSISALQLKTFMQDAERTFLKEKKIAVATHFSLTGFMEHLEEYLVQKKIEKFLIIEHPMHPVPGKSRSVFRLHKQGQLQKKGASSPSSSIGVINHIKVSLLTVWWIMRSKEQWDLYIGNNGLNTFAGLIVKKLRKVKKVVFYSVHFVPSRFKNKLLNNFYHWVDKIAVIFSDEVWVLSPRMIEGRRKYLHLSKKYDKKQVLVPEGVWLDRIKRKEFNKIQRHTAIFVGTLTKRMGVHLVIKSIPYILKMVPDFRLIIVGKGSFREDLEKLIAKLDLGKHAIFRGFIESHKDVENLVASCAVGMATYTKDESGLTYYADPAKTKLYLGAGIPTVMTDSFYNAQDIVNAGAGIVVKDNKGEIAEAIIKIISSEINLKQYRKNALLFAREFDHSFLFTKHLRRIFFGEKR